MMRSMPAESVHCVVSSPPYWGLRDYGQDGQLGLEPTPEQYVENMVAVFREVRRVLRSDGTVWLNLGDSYAGGATTDKKRPGAGRADGIVDDRAQRNRNGVGSVPGLKPKDLVGIPWRVAFALQADGWYLRSDIIWSKPNPMPESVTDRPTKSHEYLFLLAKSPRYYFDADAVREGALIETWPGIGPKHGTTDNHKSDYNPMTVNAERNIRSVWTIATQPYPGAHFATFPRKLVEPCIKAGTSERGVCSLCGSPWRRLTSVTRGERDDSTRDPVRASARRGAAAVPEKGWESERLHVGWASPDCGHTMADGASPIAATVLDPFAGSGTTGLVAQSLSRRAVLIDLNGDYLDQAMARNRHMPLGLST